MIAWQTALENPTFDQFVSQLLESHAFSTSYAFQFTNDDGDVEEVLVLAMRTPVAGKDLIAMTNVLVDSCEVYRLWKDGKRPTADDLPTVSPA